MALTIGGKRRKPGGGPPATPLTPIEQRLVRRLVTALNALASNMDTDAYVEAINSLDPDMLQQLLLQASANLDVVSRMVDDALRGVVLSGGTAEAKTILRNAPRTGQNPFLALEYGGKVLPSGIVVPGSLTPPDVEFVIATPPEQMFTFINQKAADYARFRSAQLVTAVDDSNRLAIRKVIARAVTGTQTVDQTAKSLRQIVGLHPRWADAVLKFNDRNFRQFVRGGMSTDAAAQLADKMTGRYRMKLIRRRAEMIARTEIQTAQNFGREASWQAAEKTGLVDPRAQKEWKTAPTGSRYGPPCPICAELRGTRVPWNGSFSNGSSMPPAHPNCRCTAVLIPPNRGLTGLPSQDMTDWIAELDRLEAEDAARG